MPQHLLVAEALETWREAERLLGELPPLSPDHETVAIVVHQSRDVYQRLTVSGRITAEVIAASRSSILTAHHLLKVVRERSASDLVEGRRAGGVRA